MYEFTIFVCFNQGMTIHNFKHLNNPLLKGSIVLFLQTITWVDTDILNVKQTIFLDSRMLKYEHFTPAF